MEISTDDAVQKIEEFYTSLNVEQKIQEVYAYFTADIRRLFYVIFGAILIILWFLLKDFARKKLLEGYAYIKADIKRLFFIILGAILIIGFLVSHLNYLLNPYPLPASVLYTDIVPGHAVVTFLSANPFRGCVYYQRVKALFGRFICEKEETATHRIEVSGLVSGDAYKIRIGYGINWWSKYRAEVQPNFETVTPSTPITELPFLTTPSGVIAEDDGGKVEIKGSVVDASGNPQAKALVVFAKQPDLILYTTMSASDGMFSLTVPHADGNAEFIVNAWTDQAYGTIVESADRFNKEKKPIVVEQYR